MPGRNSTWLTGSKRLYCSLDDFVDLIVLVDLVDLVDLDEKKEIVYAVGRGGGSRRRVVHRARRSIV
jgi:hypothetical protein